MKKALVICAHSDDAVIGCGGTIKLLAESNFNVSVVSVCGDRVDGFDDSMKLLGACSYYLNYFYGSIETALVENELRKFISQFEPDFIFTHWKEEILLDHATVSEVVSRLSRKYEKELIYFEIPASSISFEFNFAFDITRAYFDKIRAIMKMRKSFTDNVFKKEVLPSVIYTPGFRGIQVGCRYAEVFYFCGRRNPLSSYWWALRSVNDL